MYSFVVKTNLNIFKFKRDEGAKNSSKSGTSYFPSCFKCLYLLKNYLTNSLIAEKRNHKISMKKKIRYGILIQVFLLVLPNNNLI